MSQPRKHAAFTDLWRSVSKLNNNNNNNNTTTTQDREPGQQMPGSSAHVVGQDLQSPKQRRCSRYAALHHGDSPGDTEPTQDIIWDPTSPTATAVGSRNIRVVQISDIVNRIAPESQDVRQRDSESPLLQWIGDSVVTATPDIPKTRVRKRSSRQSSVDDLLKLARQFDQNMQEDRATSDPGLAPPPSDPDPGSAPPPSDPAEAELHALFDCSTQRVSGRLSQGSAPSSTQDVEGARAARPDDFDDDWDDDDLVLAMTQQDPPPPVPKTNRRTFTLAPDANFLSTAKTASVPVPRFSSDSVWDDGDDALLYQACASIETTRQNQTATRKPQFGRSNSLPGATGGESACYRGWDVAMTGGGTSPATFNRFGNASGTLGNAGTKATQQESKGFKRNKSDSAVISNKVFVTSQTLKCSAAEIERKKQEALARRRLRMSKP